MAYSDSPRRQIPHAFAYGGRSPSTSPRKQYPSVDTTPTSPSSPTSPSYPRSSFDHEDPSSPLTPLWAMSSFVTSSSFSRSPTSVTLNEIGPPRLGSFDWSRSGPAESIEFSLKEFVSKAPPTLPCLQCCSHLERTDLLASHHIPTSCRQFLARHQQRLPQSSCPWRRATTAASTPARISTSLACTLQGFSRRLTPGRANRQRRLNL
jgi:hypothetical protein